MAQMGYLQSLAMTFFVKYPESLNKPLQIIAEMRKVEPNESLMDLKMAYAEALVEYHSCLLRDASRNYAEAMNYLDKIYADMDNRGNDEYVRAADPKIRTFGKGN